LQILVATRRLERAMTQRGGEQISIARSDGLDFGTTVPYARYHQRGTERMPRRRVAQLPDRARRDIVRAIQRGVVAGDRRPL
jgi:hypothetical protein